MQETRDRKHLHFQSGLERDAVRTGGWGGERCAEQPESTPPGGAVHVTVHVSSGLEGGGRVL